MRGDSILRPRKPWSKWTRDTERAFLLALRQTGQVSKAAAEIGRSRSAAQSRRRTHAGFGREWDRVIAEQQAEWIAATQARLGAGLDEAGGGRLTPWRDRTGGWDARKRGLFLRVLARTKRVDAACEAAGMTASAAYYLRGQSPRFAAAWEKALAAASSSVLEAAYARAVEGWDEPVWQGGAVVGMRRRFSEGLLRDLLKRELAAEKAAGGGKKLEKWRRVRTPEEVTQSILTKLSNFDRQREEQEAAQQAADWARSRACWGEMSLGLAGVSLDDPLDDPDREEDDAFDSEDCLDDERV